MAEDVWVIDMTLLEVQALLRLTGQIPHLRVPRTT